MAHFLLRSHWSCSHYEIQKECMILIQFFLFDSVIVLALNYLVINLNYPGFVFAYLRVYFPKCVYLCWGLLTSNLLIQSLKLSQNKALVLCSHYYYFQRLQEFSIRPFNLFELLYLLLAFDRALVLCFGCFAVLLCLLYFGYKEINIFQAQLQ